MARDTFQGFVRKLAAAIRARRRAAGMTLEDLAHEANVTVRTLTAIETAKGNPTVRTLFQIAKALHLNVRDLTE